jgi:hypothetical protein
MKKLPKLLALAITLPLAAVMAATLLALALAAQTAPLVGESAEVSASDVERALQILRNHDPRRDRPGVPRTVVITQRDLELLVNHGGRRWLAAPAARVRLQPYNAQVQASLRLPGLDALPVAVWLNLDAHLREAEGLPELTSLRVGRLPVPGWLAEALARRIGAHYGVVVDPQIARDLVHRVSMTNGAVTIRYAWQADLQYRVLAALVPPAEQARLKVYADHLHAIAPAPGADGTVSLTELMPPMFQLAQQRAAAGADAAEENRAALVVLAFYASGRRLSSIVPAARDWPRPPGLRVTLHGRDDFPQHFLVSALLAAEGGGPLANAVGLYKEVMDSRGGSGFSFNDIAADRAGTRFGELAVSDPARMQLALNAGVGEYELMPDVSDLPEFLAEPEFLRRYGGVGAAAYRNMLADIETRIDNTPLLR